MMNDYAVSPTAYPPTYSASSLAISIPAFRARFEGGQIVAFDAASIELPGGMPSCVWFDASGCWVVSSLAEESLRNCILYGYATTTASGIVAFVQSARVDASLSASVSGTKITRPDGSDSGLRKPGPFERVGDRLTHSEAASIDGVRAAFEGLNDYLERVLPPGREKALTLTYLELSGMLATKAISHVPRAVVDDAAKAPRSTARDAEGTNP
jgi:hypothetical protein